MEKPRHLYTINAIRVVAEYMVVRFHVLNHSTDVHGPIGEDIMCFFYVLSGFVVMHACENDDFSTWTLQKAFIKKRLLKLYPVFLVNWLAWVPYIIKVLTKPKEKACIVHQICPFLQLVMLDCWTGCGYNFLVNGVSWFVSALVWMWILFPFAKNSICSFFVGHKVWTRMIWLYLVFACMCIPLWGFDLYTICTQPWLRVGEFLIGCGAAIALKHAPPTPLLHQRYWVPLTLAILFYNVQSLRHGMDFLCLHEDAQHTECVLWQWGQPFKENHPPCITVMEKIVNKYALVFACVIHGLARDEMAGNSVHSFMMRLLRSDLFEFLSSFSLVLYLSHQNMYMLLVFIGENFLGCTKFDWSDDTMLFCVYTLCYVEHRLLKGMEHWFLSQQGSRMVEPPEDAAKLLAPVITPA